MSTTKRRPLVAGNWKMNGGHAANQALMAGLRAGTARWGQVDVLVCPPAVYLESVGKLAVGSGIALGAQNLAESDKAGAYTGEIHEIGRASCRERVYSSV